MSCRAPPCRAPCNPEEADESEMKTSGSSSAFGFQATPDRCHATPSQSMPCTTRRWQALQDFNPWLTLRLRIQALPRLALPYLANALPWLALPSRALSFAARRQQITQRFLKLCVILRLRIQALPRSRRAVPGPAKPRPTKPHPKVGGESGCEPLSRPPLSDPSHARPYQNLPSPASPCTTQGWRTTQGASPWMILRLRIRAMPCLASPRLAMPSAARRQQTIQRL